MTAGRISAGRPAPATEAEAARPAREIATLPIDAPDWKQFVRSQAEALGYHDPAWGLMLAECYGFRPFALGLFERGTILAGLPVVETRTLRRKTEMDLPSVHGPLSSPRRHRIGVARIGRRTRSVPTTRQRGTPGRSRARLGPVDVHSCGRVHPCRRPHSGERLALRRTRPFAGSARHQALASRRRRDQARRAESDLTKIFYDLHLHTRRRHGIPVQPRAVFRAALENGSSSLATASSTLAYSGRIPVAGAVFLIGRETLTYKYNASRPEFWRERPNHALIWHAMEWACASGFRTFDFGLTHFPNRGLRDFKRRWAARRGAFSTARSSPTQHSRAVRSTGLPERALGAVIRHGPLWLCRGVGELLYKHAA